MTTDPKNDDSGAEAGRDQALWELLGKARPVRVSPYFARRVLRDLDAADAPAKDLAAGWRAWLRSTWILTAGTTVLFAVVCGVVAFPSFWGTSRLVTVAASLPPVRQASQVSQVSQVSPLSRPPAELPAQAAAPANTPATASGTELASDVSAQDVDVIADLDNLVAREETSVWTDDTSRF